MSKEEHNKHKHDHSEHNDHEHHGHHYKEMMKRKLSVMATTKIK
jgi:hypothetical protein